MGKTGFTKFKVYYKNQKEIMHPMKMNCMEMYEHCSKTWNIATNKFYIITSNGIKIENNKYNNKSAFFYCSKSKLYVLEYIDSPEDIQTFLTYVNNTKNLYFQSQPTPTSIFNSKTNEHSQKSNESAENNETNKKNNELHLNLEGEKEERGKEEKNKEEKNKKKLLKKEKLKIVLALTLIQQQVEENYTRIFYNYCNFIGGEEIAMVDILDILIEFFFSDKNLFSIFFQKYKYPGFNSQFLIKNQILENLFFWISTNKYLFTPCFHSNFPNYNEKLSEFIEYIVGFLNTLENQNNNAWKYQIENISRGLLQLDLFYSFPIYPIHPIFTSFHSNDHLFSFHSPLHYYNPHNISSHPTHPPNPSKIYSTPYFSYYSLKSQSKSEILLNFYDISTSNYSQNIEYTINDSNTNPLFKYSPEDIAKQLTVIDNQLFTCKFKIIDFLEFIYPKYECFHTFFHKNKKTHGTSFSSPHAGGMFHHPADERLKNAYLNDASFHLPFDINDRTSHSSQEDNYMLKSKDTCSVVTIITRFKYLYEWVIYEILTCPSLKYRFSIFDIFFEISSFLFHFNNFHSFLAISHALLNSSILNCFSAEVFFSFLFLPYFLSSFLFSIPSLFPSPFSFLFPPYFPSLLFLFYSLPVSSPFPPSSLPSLLSFSFISFLFLLFLFSLLSSLLFLFPYSIVCSIFLPHSIPYLFLFATPQCNIPVS